MKQIDNRQKKQVVSKAQGTFTGSKNRLIHSKDKMNQFAPSEHDQAEAQSSEPKSQKGIAETIHRTDPKVGRNDACPCGSGKKFKKCCLESK